MDYNNQDNVDKELEDLFSDEYSGLVSHLNGLFQTFKNNREYYNRIWLEDIRQYDGKYDSTVKLIEGNSKIFDEITKKKTDQAIAYLINLCLPQGNKNFSMVSTPLPTLPEPELQKIMAELMSKLMKNQQTDENGNVIPVVPTMDDINHAIKTVSDIRALKMENLILDQLSDQKYSYTSVISNVIESACKLGSGVALGPYARMEKETYVVLDEFNNLSIKNRQVPKPYLEFISLFDCFFDLEARRFGEDEGAFFYKTMTRSQFEDLKNNDTYIADNVKKYLRNTPNGNYSLEPYEQQMKNTNGESTISPTTCPRFRIKEFWGSVPTKHLQGIIDNLPDTMDVEVNVWIIDSTIIKCVLNPLNGRPYSVYNLFRSQDKLLGYGYPRLMRSDQMALNSSVRLRHDNMVLSSAPKIVVHDDALAAGQVVSQITPHMVIHTDYDDTTVNRPAIEVIRFDSHIPELTSVINSYRENIDDITSIGSVLEGNFQGMAESARTTPGVNAIMSNANNVIKQQAKNFDAFIQNYLQLFKDFNMQFYWDESVKGDSNVMPLVSDSIVEKNIKANKLNQLVLTLTPEERQFINWEQMLTDRIIANDLDPDDVKLSANEIANRQAQAQQAQAQQMQMAQQAQQMQQAQAQVDMQSKASKSNLDQAKAQALADGIDLQRLNSLSKVQQDQAKQNLAEGQFTNQIMNEDTNNLTREELIAMIQRLESQNPNITKQGLSR